MNTLTPFNSAELSEHAYFSSRAMKSKKSITLHSALMELPQGIKAGVISKYESNGFSLVDFFRASTGYFSSTDSTFGFIAEGINNGQGENRKGESLITIKGTNSWADTKTDLKTLPTNFNGHMTHRGFVQTFRSFEHHIDRYLDWHSPSKIHLVYYSLDGFTTRNQESINGNIAG